MYLSFCISPSLSLSISLCLYLFVSLCIFLYFSVSFCILRMSLYISVSLPLSLSISLCPYLSVPLCMSLCLSVSLCIFLCFSVSFCMSLYISVSLPLSLSKSLCLYVGVSFCTFLYVSVPLCTSQYLSVSLCIFLFLFFFSLSLSLFSCGSYLRITLILNRVIWYRAHACVTCYLYQKRARANGFFPIKVDACDHDWTDDCHSPPVYSCHKLDNHAESYSCEINLHRIQSGMLKPFPGMIGSFFFFTVL